MPPLYNVTLLEAVAPENHETPFSTDILFQSKGRFEPAMVIIVSPEFTPVPRSNTIFSKLEIPGTMLPAPSTRRVFPVTTSAEGFPLSPP